MLEFDVLFEVFEFDLIIIVWIIDDVEWLDEWVQIVVFNFVNEVCVYLYVVIVIFGVVVLMVMLLCEDLCIWLGWGLVYWLCLFFDVDKVEVLCQVVCECGMQFLVDVLQWFVMYFYCDMLSLMVLLDVFDIYLFVCKCVVILLFVCDMFVLMK